MSAVIDPGLTYRHYMDLISYKVYAELRTESSRTYAGYLWWVIDPIISLSVYALVFGVFMKRGGPDFVPFLAVGVVVFRWFNVSVLRAANSLIQHKGLIQRIYVPKPIFPAVAVLADGAKVVFLFSTLLGFLWLWGAPHRLEVYSALPTLGVVTFVLILGTGTLLAALMPLLPDIELLLGNLFRLLFFISGVFFRVEDVPPDFQAVVLANPVAFLIESFRGVLLYDRSPDWTTLGMVTVFGLLSLLIGLMLMRRLDRRYAKIS